MSLAKMPECGDDLHINFFFEWHDNVEDFIHACPMPLVEFLFVAGWRQIYFAVFARKAQRNPLLLLAAILSKPTLPKQVGWYVIGEPAIGLFEKFS